MRYVSRTVRRSKLVWLIAGLSVAAFIGYQVSQTTSIHAEKIAYDQSGEKMVVECTLVNPTSVTVDVIATLKMTAGHQTKYSSPMTCPAISKSLTLEPKQSKILRYDTNLSFKPSALRTRVEVEILQERPR